MSRHGAKSRYNFQRDKNEQIIKDALEARGYHVDQINGKGFPDLVVTKHGHVWFVEVKQPKGTYNQNQIDWRAKWQGPPPICLRTVEQALTFPTVEGEPSADSPRSVGVGEERERRERRTILSELRARDKRGARDRVRRSPLLEDQGEGR